MRIKKLFTISVMLLQCLCALAQEVEFPYDRLLKKGNYEKAEKKIKESIQKEQDATIYYAAFELYSRKEFSGYNPRMAYDYLVASERFFRDADFKATEKLMKNGYDGSLYYNKYKLVGKLALEQAVSVNTISAYEDFLNYFSNASYESREEATERRNALAFEDANRSGTEEAYNHFLATYPYAKEKSKATQLRNAVAYANAEKSGTKYAYEQFIDKYPTADEAKQAWKHVYDMAFAEAKYVNTEYGYRAYVREYPNSPYTLRATKIADQLEYNRVTTPGDWNSYKNYINNHSGNTEFVEASKREIYAIAKNLHNIEALEYGMKNFDRSMADSCFLVLHDVYAENGYTKQGEFFSNYYISFSSCQKLRDLKNKYNAISHATDDDFIRSAAPFPCAYYRLKTLISDDLNAKRWANALKVVKKYKDVFKGNHYYKNLLTVLEAPADYTIKVNNIGSGINTKVGSEYAPTISADDKTLFFCGKNREDNLGGEDIFFSKKTNGVWSKAKPVSDLNTWLYNEAPLALSADGTRLIMFKSGELAISNKTSSGWGEPEKMPSTINICDWQADAMIASNGKALLFAARKQSQHELYESNNIYVSLMDENGEWGEPIELGPTINTPGNDRSPILHPDMKTLYFCSDGHGSLGGLDVFKSIRLNEDSWTEWSEPVSLGKEVNTPESECWYKISTDGKKAYFSKTDENQKEHIFWLNLPMKMRPNPVATISGKLVDSKGKSIVTNIRWEDLSDHEIIGESKTDPEDGSYFITLPMGRNYGYYIDDDDYFPLSDNIDLTRKNENIVIENDLKVASVEQMVQDSVAMPMNNLFFEVGDSTLLNPSISELKRVAKLISRMNRKVEISGHTDDTGDDKFNQKLSEGRAAAAKRFLIEQGIDENLLISVGYGKRKPVATNKTVKGRKLNRRVEMRFVH